MFSASVGWFEGGEEKVYDAPGEMITDWKHPVGWLVSDGTSLDSERTAFFDALRLTYLLDEYDTSTMAEIVKFGAGIVD